MRRIIVVSLVFLAVVLKPQTAAAYEVGYYADLEDRCRAEQINSQFWDAILGIFLRGAEAVGGLHTDQRMEQCRKMLQNVKDQFTLARNEAEYNLASLAGVSPFNPGYPANNVHEWGARGHSILIQDFRGGTWGDAAIIYNPIQKKAHYIAGSYWSRYKVAIQQWNEFPGYPLNLEHAAGSVIVQDFGHGTWGDAGIIGTASADWVSGTHWKTYIRGEVSGSIRLLNPVRYAIDGTTGTRSQYFQRGAIHVQTTGLICVNFYDERGITIETKWFGPW